MTKKKSSKRRRIVISDDENEDSDAEGQDSDAEGQDSDNLSDAGERNVFYDSEENEIEAEPEEKGGAAFIGKKGRLVKFEKSV